MNSDTTPSFETNEDAIEHVMGILDAEDAAENEKQPKESPEGEKTAAPDKAPSGKTEEKDEVDEPETAIEPPHSWTKELKAKWSTIPEDVQREIAQHETERQSGLGKKLEESASATKAAKEAEARAEQERQRFAQLSEYVSQNAMSNDPVLAKIASIKDWPAFARENPAEAYALETEGRQRVANLQAVEAERQRIAQDQQVQLIQKGTEALKAAIPEWSDDGKRAELQNELVEVAKAYGYTPEEYGNIFDHRNIIVLRDLKEFRALKAAQASLSEKKAAPAAPRMARPGTGTTPNAASAQQKALRARFNASGKESDAIALVNALIGD